MVPLLPLCFVCSCVEMSYLELGRYLINIKRSFEDKEQYAENGGREWCRVQVFVVAAGMWWPDLTVETKDNAPPPATPRLPASGRASERQPSDFRFFGDCLNCTGSPCLRPHPFPGVANIPWLKGSEAAKPQHSHNNTGQLWRVINQQNPSWGSAEVALCPSWWLALSLCPVLPRCLSSHNIDSKSTL